MIVFFPLCDFGDKVTNRFTSLCDSYYEILWYHLPLAQQKHIILMILNAQRPIYLDGFMVQCTREMFKKVRNNKIELKHPIDTIFFLFSRLWTLCIDTLWFFVDSFEIPVLVNWLSILYTLYSKVYNCFECRVIIFSYWKHV